MSVSVREALATLRELRRDDDIVITTMSAAREWMTLGSHPLDLVFVPSAMGHATSVGLGLALAQPQRRVIVCNGDGSMLMNLGSLVTIVAQAPRNLVIVLFDNGVYEVTGAQPTAGSSVGRRGGEPVDFAAVARGCGFRSVYRFSSLEAWAGAVGGILEAEGPTFVVLEAEPMVGIPGPKSPGPTAERAAQFMRALG
jgi:sulfopyruvate decarboxylase subunit beta